MKNPARVKFLAFSMSAGDHLEAGPREKGNLSRVQEHLHSGVDGLGNHLIGSLHQGRILFRESKAYMCHVVSSSTKW